MAREFRVINALGATDVPVPAPVALCEDAEVLGRPFYLMSFVDGLVLERPDQARDRAHARQLSEQLVDTLLALHSVDPVGVGLADLGRPVGFRERQVRRWHQQFVASWPEEHPLELDVVARLGGTVPPSGPIGIVHGDYRLTNLMFSRDLDRVAAVVDWEMATIGDPLSDVGMLYAYHELARLTGGVMADFDGALGYLGPNELLERYAGAVGLDPAQLDWYIAFGFFKAAGIGAGIHARFRQGKTVGEGFEIFGDLVEIALTAAQARLNHS
jgi:aminoglycoside phosphotransferase (APT) family kinase protein